MRGLLLFCALLLLLPTVAAQPKQVEGCARQCDPRAEDVNGPEPKRGQEPVKVVLYGHFEDLLQRAPLNTQAPDPEREIDLNGGFLMPTIDTNTPCEVCNVHFDFNAFQMYSSPGLVEFLDGGWRIHQEPGLAMDVRIADEEITLYWYLSAHAVPGKNSGNTASVGVMPQVGVYARMETGRFPFKGTLLAESDRPEDTTPPNEQRVNMVSVPGSPDVYEFQVKLHVQDPVLPSHSDANGFIVSVHPYQLRSGGHEGQDVAQSDWRLRSGPRFPNRIILPVEQTMATKSATLSIFDDRLFVRWSLLSAWGSYDMRDLELRLTSTAGPTVDAKAIDFIRLHRGLDHDAHFKPVNATWAIDFRNYPLEDGNYELTASIPNLQRTYLLEHRFDFAVAQGVPQVPVIGGGSVQPLRAADGPEDGGRSPGVGTPLLLVGLAALAIARARARA